MSFVKFADMEPMPPLVAFIQISGSLGIPIGSGVYEEAIIRHPEYFTAEIELREKWRKVPPELWEKYLNERRELEKKLIGDIYKGKGLHYYVSHADEARRCSIEYDQRAKKAKPEFKALFERYFSAYGLQFMG